MKPFLGSSRFTKEATPEAIRECTCAHLRFSLARMPESATPRDWWLATALMTRDFLIERLLATQETHRKAGVRRLYYLSLEYFLGRLLRQNLLNLGLWERTGEALRKLGVDLEEICEEEGEMGLGNGGLGRLAACFLDSLATLRLPAIGYGIHYEFGLFQQDFVRGYQIERPDDWHRLGSPWEILHPEFAQTVHLYGRLEHEEGGCRWSDCRDVLGLPFDIPIAGFGATTVNILRLWSAKSTREFDLEAFNRGGYFEAVGEKSFCESITKVLYPNDKTESGKELRLVQQYFFVACSLRDILRRFEAEHRDWNLLPEKVVIHLNDTHPAIAIVELLRILIDERKMDWERAWDWTSRIFAYTNHTLLPEALETWSVPLFHRVLPRHLELLYEINRRLLEEVPVTDDSSHQKRRAISLIEENHIKGVRMAHLAVVGSFSVNGVSALHSELLRTRLFPEFAALFPGRFRNVTNGITPRVWLLGANPLLSSLLTEVVGEEWITDLSRLRELRKFSADASFLDRYAAIKRANKVRLSECLRDWCGLTADPDALFDVQIKRIHEYKRQHLNLLHILWLYRRLLENPNADFPPRLFLFGGKAAPGYDLAKCIIKAINSVAARINRDPRALGKLQVGFIPNYGVTRASRIIPAADLSEQISTAGKEASGTGNMKLALNGAVTIGTLDGANVEIREEVGDENIFLFGLTAEQVAERVRKGYNPWEIYESDPELRAILDWLGSGEFTPGEPASVLAPLRHSLLEGGDPFLVLADFASYLAAQRRAEQTYRDRSRWMAMALTNTATVGKFSSDRSIREYAEGIWRLAPVPLPG
ncbi:glycogen phosphorylase [Methylacidimicrobium cyclopophantes]|uniref:Alpha-1,4 glucan phosphorylase n=1 Tax=Methylacidimicrobium cyclopophantes TaxID=1041766 RepID=A0A5E6MGN2_9BACT|nr:glycogen/starch/alpha-glucan phosphorylase [Methylacidimicrobium cyclopophantes]VVM07522.1 glycogen phosphorylase [Methylacidimicrobium cyclopophantes]